MLLYLHRRLSVPRAYRFVAPRGVGTKLLDLIKKPERLREGLIANWAAKCAARITATKGVPLEGKLLEHLKAFDFARIAHLPTPRLIEQHRKTPYFAFRFGLGVPARPASPAPPATIGAGETRYFARLLDAYGDNQGTAYASPATLTYAAMTLTPDGTDVLTLKYKINFRRPALGEALIAEGTVLRAGRTVTINRVDVYACDGERRTLCAAIPSTFITRCGCQHRVARAAPCPRVPRSERRLGLALLHRRAEREQLEDPEGQIIARAASSSSRRWNGSSDRLRLPCSLSRRRAGTSQDVCC